MDEIQEKRYLREQLLDLLGIPKEKCSLESELKGSVLHDDIVIEKWVWTSEPGSKVTSLLYMPKVRNSKIPAVVVANGHGGSKNSLYNHYTGQLYAKVGIACLLYDTIGEEERHVKGEKGTRAHDEEEVLRCAAENGRIVMGKMVFDTMRAIDFLFSHHDIDSENVGVTGNSLGGTIASWMLALDTRIKMAIVSGWAISMYGVAQSKACTRIPGMLMDKLCSLHEHLSLSVPHCAVLIMNGEKDYIIDKKGDGRCWDETRLNVTTLREVYKNSGIPAKCQLWFDGEGGHRAYHNHKKALLWINKYLGTPTYTHEQIKKLPEITLGRWCEKHGLKWEDSFAHLYWNEQNHKGGVYLDLDIVPISADRLKCLRYEELGDPLYTIEGWLEAIKKRV